MQAYPTLRLAAGPSALALAGALAIATLAPFAGWGEARIARAVQETALALGIDQLLARPTSELSGGELQRVALAATLAGGPQLIVLDEPASQLDPVAGGELARGCRDAIGGILSQQSLLCSAR